MPAPTNSLPSRTGPEPASVAARTARCRRNSDWMGRCRAWRSGAGLALEIGVRHVQTRHDFSFKCLHLVGLRIVLMVISVEMEKTMDREMSKVMKENPVLILAFPFERLVGDDNVTEQSRSAACVLLRRWKRQHVGWLVDPAPVAIEPGDGRIVGKHNTHFVAGC